jgi:hypothetical protein
VTKEEFINFASNTQGKFWTFEKACEVYSKYTDHHSGVMDLDHFTAFLMSSTNSVLKKEKEYPQDHSRPLTDYFINSSHNTYLLADQILGDSSVEGYIRALQKGCRCLEIDCWDGPDGNPIIYHGRTL